MAHLRIEHLTHHYPGVAQPSVHEVSLEVPASEVLALIGGSGSGKSTVLRCIAGIERPQTGRILLDERELTGPGKFVPPERRRIGLVSQSGDLFPHLTVRKNVAYGLRRLPAKSRRARSLEALDMVGLADLARRYPAELSGGEAQRVALARALAFEPDLLLLDEPFSNLDVVLRDRLRGLTLDLLRERGVTAIFVTHHGDDALAAGDRLAVLRAGRLVQWDSPRAVFENPADPEVAALFGGINLLPGAHPDRPLCLRADQLQLCPASGPDCLVCGTVERIEFLGSCQQVVLRVPNREDPIRVRVPPDASVSPRDRLGVRPSVSPGDQS